MAYFVYVFSGLLLAGLRCSLRMPFHLTFCFLLTITVKHQTYINITKAQTRFSDDISVFVVAVVPLNR